MSTYTELKAMVHPAVQSGEASGKYTAKLGFVERCEILALRRLGYGRDLLARIYKLNPRTVARILDLNASVYKGVREELLRIGEPAFVEKYATKDVIDRANAAVTAKLEQPKVETTSHENASTADKRMGQKKGKHVTKEGTFCIIEWGDHHGETGPPVPRLGDDLLPGGQGWYVTLPDLYPGDYFGAFNTSGEALKYVEENGL